MLISYKTHLGGLDTSTGYGYAGQGMVESLVKLGHQVHLDDRTSPVQFMFTQPTDYEWDSNQYSIGLTPWESTEVHPGWIDKMKTADEIWATSELNKLWYERLGLEVTTVYPHGITHNWTPRLRKRGKKLRFLHVGEPAPRKCGQMAFNAFLNLFKDNEDVSLTIKANGHTGIRYDPGIPGILLTPDDFPNVKVINRDVSEEEMVSLYHSHDVLLYPSYGEGFGFIPIQGLATGMPVIFNSDWAPYAKYDLGLKISDRLVPSPWKGMHPGLMLEPEQQSLEHLMVSVYENYDFYASEAFNQANALHHEFDWLRQTQKAFSHVVNRFE